MERAFILGNGPSLANVDLNSLKNEVTFATNRIHLLYPRTEWRPTHYVRSEFPYEDSEDVVIDDLIQAYQVGCAIYLVESYRGFVMQRKLRRYQQATTREEYFAICSHGDLHFDSPDVPRLWHLPEVCSFGSSVNVAIQIASKEGYGPLYLMGCDLGYEDGKPNHFTDEYEKAYERFRPAVYANGDTLYAHNVAFRSSPVPIYNCTVGGQLEVYPRLSLEEALHGPGLQPGQRRSQRKNVVGDQSEH